MHRARRTLWTAFLAAGWYLWALGAPAGAEEVKVGRGSYNTTLPPGAKGPSDGRGRPASPYVTKNVTGPIPTTDWWTTLVWKRRPESPYSSNLYAHPLAFRATRTGLGVSYPTRPTTTPDGRNYNFHYSEDLVVGVAGLQAPDTRVDGFGDWTVTACWDDGTRSLKATIGHGLPYVYCVKAGGDAAIEFKGKPVIWHNRGGVVGATVNGHHYGIFGPGPGAPGSWQADGGGLRSTLAGKDYFSVGLLPDNTAATLELFHRHAYAFVTDTRVTWRYDQAKAVLTTRFEATTRAMEGAEARPLMALYRHQWLNTSAKLTPHAYISARGPMKLLVGLAFETAMTFHGVLPALPDAGGLDRARLRGYVDEAFQACKPLRRGDTYWTGKALGRLAALAHIADQVGHAEARGRFLQTIRNELEDWFQAPDGKGAKVFCYDRAWGTLIGYPASYGSDTQLNDHQFHYGYFIMAAAAVARFDRQWADERNWGGMVKLLIHDADNPTRPGEAAAGPGRGEGRFCFLRCFDPHAGHSWASGHGEFAAGNNQESSSESMNFATAVILWGAATGDNQMRDLGIFLYANEAAAVEQYWFDVDQAVFPKGYTHSTLGILWSNGGAYGTWWTGNPEEIHGINFLPITGGSLYLGYRPDYVARNYQDMVKTNPGPETEWRDIIWSFQALADPAAAVAKLQKQASYKATDGESKAHTYHWVCGLSALGQVDTKVTADAPTYAVFSRGGVQTHVAYNPGPQPAVVAFSDGAKLTVPPGALVCDRKAGATAGR